jgi:hypothetical protein
MLYAAQIETVHRPSVRKTKKPPSYAITMAALKMFGALRDWQLKPPSNFI